jgi:predicted dehydrogenase
MAIKLAHVGLGYWGPNLLRNWYKLGVLKAAFDKDEAQILAGDKRELKFKEYGREVYFGTDWETALGRKDIDAISIATPPHTHYYLVKEAILNNKHVFVEKPFTLEVNHAEELCELAAKKKRILMVGHTFLYSPEVRALKKITSNDNFGKILYLYTQRLNLGKIQSPTNVIGDLAPHDISIFNYITEQSPEAVQAFAKCHVLHSSEDVAFINLQYKENISGHLHLSWLDPLKVRRYIVVGSKQMAVCDSGTVEIKVYNKGVEVKHASENYGDFILNYKYGDVIIPHFEMWEPLYFECKSFIEHIENNTTPLSDGLFSLEVVKTVDAIQKAAVRSGEWIEL